MNKLIKLFSRLGLKIIPLISFPRLNNFFFRKQGYDIDPSARIYSSVKMIGNIKITVGKNTFIGSESVITGGLAKVEIGSHCDISDRVSICCGTHKVDEQGLRSAGEGIGKDIKIGNGVWIGYGALILPGVKVGDKAIIGAGSVVSKDVQPRTIVAGNPIKVIRQF